MRLAFAPLAAAGKTFLNTVFSRTAAPKLSPAQQDLADNLAHFSNELQHLSDGRFRVSKAYPGKNATCIKANILDGGAPVVRLTGSWSKQGEARFLVIPPQGTIGLTTYGVENADGCLMHLKHMRERRADLISVLSDA